MFVIKDKDIPLPTPYPRVYRKLPTVKESGWTRFDNFTIRKDIDLCPQPGLQEKVVASECNLIFLAGEATMGKALSINEFVLSQDGWVKMKDVCVGNKLVDVWGDEQSVTGVYPQGLLRIYRVEMEDGGSCRVSADHIWYVFANGEWFITTTEDLLYSIHEDGAEVYLPTYLSYTENKRKIKAIIETEDVEECACISVSSKEKLFVVRDYIVTHNTFSGYLKALNGIDKPNYTAKLISKRLQDSKKGGSLLRDFKVVFDGFAGCEVSGADYPTAAFPQWNSSIQMMHMNYNTKNESEWKEFQDYAKKNQCSYAYWDEVTEIEEFRTFAYFFSRNRDASGVRPTTVCSFNALHEHWTTSFLKQGGYIGPDWYLIPETLGKIRYFYVKGDTVEAVEFADTRDELVRRCKLQPTPEEEAIGITAHDLVKSFTVFSGHGADNRILAHQTGGGSIANLYNVGETERLKIKHAYFGPIEKEDVRISQQSIADIFVIPADRSTDRYASMDVAAGGDVCVMMIWEGHTLIAIETSDRREPDEIEMWAAAMLTKYKVPVENFSFDASGSGFFMRRFKQGVPIISNTRPIIEYDEAGNKSVMEAYYTHRSQLLGKLEAALVKGEISCRIDKFMRFPHGPKRIQTTLLDILVEERNVFRRIDRNGKIYYRNKDEFKTSYKLSPDYIDAMAYRMVFDLDARPRKQKARVYGASDYRLVWDFDLPGM